MKKILLAALLFCGKIAFAQARLGSTYSDIYNEFISTFPTTRTTDEGELLLVVNQNNVLNYYYFTEKKECYMTVTYPVSDGALNGLVEVYNKRYVIISDTEWKMYSNGFIANIKLVTHEGISFFIWQFAQ